MDNVCFVWLEEIVSIKHRSCNSSFKTGTLTGIIVVLMSLIKLRFKYKLPIFMFIGCFIGDLITHDTHYGYWWTEAAITALVASSLSFALTFTPAGKKIEEFLK